MNNDTSPAATSSVNLLSDDATATTFTNIPIGTINLSESFGKFSLLVSIRDKIKKDYAISDKEKLDGKLKRLRFARTLIPRIILGKLPPVCSRMRYFGESRSFAKLLVKMLKELDYPYYKEIQIQTWLEYGILDVHFSDKINNLSSKIKDRQKDALRLNRLLPHLDWKIREAGAICNSEREDLKDCEEKIERALMDIAKLSMDRQRFIYEVSARLDQGQNTKYGRMPKNQSMVNFNRAMDIAYKLDYQEFFLPNFRRK